MFQMLRLLEWALFKKNTQTLRLCGRHSHGGDWSAKQNMFAFPLQIRTVEQQSPHLFKSLAMSFNTTSLLPLPPLCMCISVLVCLCVCVCACACVHVRVRVSMLVDNASGHFVLHCNTLPVNFQRNARLTL